MPLPLFATDAMLDVFSERSRIARMLEFEAALARAEGSVGVIPHEAAEAIAAQCNVDGFDVAAIERDARKGGNLAIPLVAALTGNVAAAAPEAKGYVHWGATSQDVIDTGLVLQLRDAFALIDADVDSLAAALAAQVRRHATTVLAGRTWLQQALPVTLGIKLAAVLSALDRHRERLAAAKRQMLVVQFGGAAGTLASLGDRGLAVTEALASNLALGVPDTPWHTQRDRLCDVAATLGLLVATLGKLARDLSLLAQTEVGEAQEPALPGRGGSSTMPQKRNPVGAAVALEAAVRVPGLVATMLTAAVQEHERGLGNWPAEWTTLPDIALSVSGALAAMVEVIEGLDVDAERMRANLDITQGLIFAEAVQMALAPSIGRGAAHSLVASACRRASAEHVHLREILAQEPGVTAVLDARQLAQLFEARNYLGATEAFIARVLAAHPARGQ
ncbi:MAG TPA: 3-carboxy-cis,cis-muconate cycloisomerase [Casimicrobiaceae bacterium]|nr:3-carboxy-cis,cis-muconate cycloisomerase [Casimicrobiaceae bacterium]